MAEPPEALVRIALAGRVGRHLVPVPGQRVERGGGPQQRGLRAERPGQAVPVVHIVRVQALGTRQVQPRGAVLLHRLHHEAREPTGRGRGHRGPGQLRVAVDPAERAVLVRVGPGLRRDLGPPVGGDVRAAEALPVVGDDGAPARRRDGDAGEVVGPGHGDGLRRRRGAVGPAGRRSRVVGDGVGRDDPGPSSVTVPSGSGALGSSVRTAVGDGSPSPSVGAAAVSTVASRAAPVAGSSPVLTSPTPAVRSTLRRPRPSPDPVVFSGSS